jgi:hydroxymethylbilane synthase
MDKVIRIGTRESQLAVWQADTVKEMLGKNGFAAELVYIKSEGDIDLQTPLYEMGVQGVFTRSLDIALLNDKIDIAVHSMKDVPTQLAKGIVQSAVLKRASYKDIFVYNGERNSIEEALGMVNGEWPMANKENKAPHSSIDDSPFTIATSSIRRKAQWLNRYPGHTIENLRGNVNTRLRKVKENNWDGAIFAAAGLERIDLRPENSFELDWMLPAPAQGAIMVVCRDGDMHSLHACEKLDDAGTTLCTKIERDFLRTLLGGCSTPISALAQIKNDMLFFKGNILSIDGKEKAEIEMISSLTEVESLGIKAAQELLNKGGQQIADAIRNASK